MVARLVRRIGLVLLLPGLVWAAVGHDHSTTAFTNGSVGSLTFSFTAGSVSNGLLTVCIVQRDNTADFSGTPPTFNGDAMTRISLYQHTAAGVTVELWRLINPDATTANIVLTSNVLSAMATVASLWTGVHQTTPAGTPASTEAPGDLPIAVDVSSAVEDLVADCAGVRNGNLFPLSAAVGQTQHGYVSGTQGGTADAGAGVSSKPGGTPTVNMQWNNTAGADSSDSKALIGVSLKPAAATTTPRRHGPIIMQ